LLNRRASEPGIDMVNNVHEKAESEEKLSVANQAKLLKAYQQVILYFIDLTNKTMPNIFLDSNYLNALLSFATIMNDT
jgi:hypothetical protein